MPPSATTTSASHRFAATALTDCKLAAGSTFEDVIAVTTQGKVRGRTKHGVLEFRGIRYARAERFGPPRPAEPWDGILDAYEFGPICPQNPGTMEALLGAPAIHGDEDCLHLNVFTPAIDDRARPVLLWIHGGAFVGGSGSTPWYAGNNLARAGDVVVVTINYRLGALGFLHLAPLLGEEFLGSGNCGIADQIAAIDWVRDNIAAFGGDPARITLFGESAGGMSVSTLLGAPGVAPKLHGAIAQSGAAEHVQTADQASATAERVLAELGGSAEALLEAPVEALLAAQAAVTAAGSAEPGSRLPFAPVLDGAVLPRHPLEVVRSGGAANVRFLNGTTAQEWNLFHLADRAKGPMPDEVLHRRLGAIAGDRARDVEEVYRASSPGISNDDLWCAVMTDHVFRQPTIRLAEAQSAHQAETRTYQFSYRSTALDGALGACHAIEIPFVFDNLDRNGIDWFLGGVGDETRALAATMSRAWTAMAHTGSPAHDGLPGWDRYSPDGRTVVEFGPTTVTRDDPDPEIRQMWTELWPGLEPAAP